MSIPLNPPQGEVVVPDRDEWSDDDPDKHRAENRIFPEPSATGSHTSMVAHPNLQVNMIFPEPARIGAGQPAAAIADVGQGPRSSPRSEKPTTWRRRVVRRVLNTYTPGTSRDPGENVGCRRSKQPRRRARGWLTTSTMPWPRTHGGLPLESSLCPKSKTKTN